MAEAAGSGGGDAPASAAAGGKRARGKAGGGSDEEPGFGDDDADWAVYRQMAGADASDSEAERADAVALAAVGAQLAGLGADSDEDEEDEEVEEEGGDDEARATTWGGAGGAGDPLDWNSDESHQITLSTERFRPPELLFQPAAIGGVRDQCGLAEALAALLRRAPADAAAALRARAPTLLSGGCARLPGMAARLAAEAMQLSPPGGGFDVFASPGGTPELDAWRGAAARAAAGLSAAQTTSRAQWEEEGPRRLARRAAATW